MYHRQKTTKDPKQDIMPKQKCFFLLRFFSCHESYIGHYSSIQLMYWKRVSLQQIFICMSSRGNPGLFGLLYTFCVLFTSSQLIKKYHHMYTPTMSVLSS